MILATINNVQFYPEPLQEGRGGSTQVVRGPRAGGPISQHKGVVVAPVFHRLPLGPILRFFENTLSVPDLLAYDFHPHVRRPIVAREAPGRFSGDFVKRGKLSDSEVRQIDSKVIDLVFDVFFRDEPYSRR